MNTAVTTITYQVNIAQPAAIAPDFVKNKMLILSGESTDLGWLRWTQEWNNLREAKQWLTLNATSQAAALHTNLNLLLRNGAKTSYTNAVTIYLNTRPIAQRLITQPLAKRSWIKWLNRNPVQWS